MDPVLLGTLINATAMVIVAVFTYLTRRDSKEARSAAEETRINVRQLEENTNSKMDMLLAAKDESTRIEVKASRAEGYLEGQEEGRADRDETRDGT